MPGESVRYRSFVCEVWDVAVRAIVSDGGVPARAPSVVLVHGLGLSHRYMMPVARALSEAGCRVYAPDLPGFGSSGHPPEVLDVPGLADALAAWMTAAGLERPALLGNSFGCQIMVDLAARYPERAGPLVIQGPTTPPTRRSWLQQWVHWRRNSPYNPPNLPFIDDSDYQRCGHGRAWKTFRLSLRDRIEDKLPQIAAPALVVRGRYDPICTLRWAEEVTRLLPRGRLVEIPVGAHTLCYTTPVELAAVAKTFIDEVEGRRPCWEAARI